MPEIHARTIFYNILGTSKYKRAANSNEFFDQIKSTISYFGNTQEMLVRQQRLANYLKKEGYSIRNASDLKQAFEELGFDKIVKNVKDLRTDPIFKGIFSDLKYSGSNEQFANQAFEFITAFTRVK
jgi:Zn-finger domain-containing protein